jgi:hypothetical protein
MGPGPVKNPVCLIASDRPNHKNTGGISVDRSTRATLSTYNAWIQVSRLQKIYQPHCLKLQKPAHPVSAGAGNMQSKQNVMVVMSQGGGEQHCLASMDSDLEAFSRNPTDDSFVALTSQLTTFTKYLNEVFLSY